MGKGQIRKSLANTPKDEHRLIIIVQVDSPECLKNLDAVVSLHWKWIDVVMVDPDALAIELGLWTGEGADFPVELFASPQIKDAIAEVQSVCKYYDKTPGILAPSVQFITQDVIPPVPFVCIGREMQIDVRIQDACEGGR
eukprot:NODE_1789_length_491_cov_66.278281_g1711_i0.p1 GENE.NODE_1789_length_491_cov_66.278281_g1711_i0~~NODE_1789_length_491_cov_66.278281_g1711_i0.p1  ORF type:complete len:149 (+),score=31.52 NODE_1789_length_491_cov_66.278281_g1711_i0:28-447(+)